MGFGPLYIQYYVPCNLSFLIVKILLYQCSSVDVNKLLNNINMCFSSIASIDILIIAKSKKKKIVPVINMAKSAVSFSPNVGDDLKKDVMNCVELHAGCSYDKYLGLPTLVGRNKCSTFNGIKEKVWKKLEGWNDRLFSVSGKEVLIKAVVQSTTMGIFKLPMCLCEELEAMISKFWCGGSSEMSRIHWVEWDRLCCRKGDGGLARLTKPWCPKQA